MVTHALQQRELVRQATKATKRARRDQQRTVEAARHLGRERGPERRRRAPSRSRTSTVRPRTIRWRSGSPTNERQRPDRT